MSRRDDILRPEGLTDALHAADQSGVRQLAAEQLIHRDDAFRPIVNRHLARRPGTRRSGSGRARSSGWSCSTSADSARSCGRTLHVEVKGWPSTVYADPVRAHAHPSMQAKHWLAEAVFSALRLRTKHNASRLWLVGQGGEVSRR